jgi:hypothetical protein
VKVASKVRRIIRPMRFCERRMIYSREDLGPWGSLLPGPLLGASSASSSRRKRNP